VIRRVGTIAAIGGLALVALALLGGTALAQEAPVRATQVPAPVAGPSSAVQMVVILTLVSLAPAIVLTCTCFARFVIVLSFLRTGLGTQGSPPNQILIGTALFMTVFVMAPTYDQVHSAAVTPYMDGKLTESQAIDAATPPIRTFLLQHTRQEDLSLFYDVSKAPRPATADEVPLRIAVPAFVLSELRTAFQMGLTVLLPFLVIDLLVALILTSMGMMMMPPVMVAMPLKLLVFVAVDGWHLIVESLLKGFM
jgi:flagellar biosynthetic protein FliP